MFWDSRVRADFREAFAALLEVQPDLEVVSQAGSLAEARRKLGGVDVALLDRSLPDGDGLGRVGELRAKLAAVAEARDTAEREHQALEQCNTRRRDLERDKDALLAEYAGVVPEALDALTPEERHAVYGKLRLGVVAQLDGSFEVTGVLGGQELGTSELSQTSTSRILIVAGMLPPALPGRQLQGATDRSPAHPPRVIRRTSRRRMTPSPHTVSRVAPVRWDRTGATHVSGLLTSSYELPRTPTLSVIGRKRCLEIAPLPSLLEVAVNSHSGGWTDKRGPVARPTTLPAT